MEKSEASTMNFKNCDRLAMLASWVLIASLCVGPWLLGSVTPSTETCLAIALGIFTLLCGIYALYCGSPLLQDRASWLAAACLAMFTIAVSLQLLDIPTWWVESLSPNTRKWQEFAAPQTPEAFGSPATDPQASAEAAMTRNTPKPKNLGFNRRQSYLVWLRMSSLLCLFIAVSALPNPIRLLRKLAISLSVAGTILAILAISERFSPPSKTVFWLMESELGRGYGPFFNKNHYPFWANISMGLTLGLLLERQQYFGKYWKREILNDALSLWLLVSISILSAGLVLSLSRGGILSLASSLAVCLIAYRSRNAWKDAIFSGASLVIIVSLIFAWVGFSIAESRLSMLWEADRYANDGRLFLWRAAVEGASKFPIFGSGGDTYPYWETLNQFGDRNWSSTNAMALRADNEFLDVFCEYGFFAALSLLCLAGVMGVTAIKQVRKDPLLLGAAVGILAVIFHSIVDFGLRIPASGSLAVVISALICSSRNKASKPATWTESHPFTELRIQSAIFVILCIVCFSVLVLELGKERTSAALQADAQGWMSEGRLTKAAVAWDSSVAANPDSLATRIGAARGLLSIALLSSDSHQRDDWRLRALKHCVRAREICPLSWQPQLWIGQHTKLLSASDRMSQYLNRAAALHPSHPTIAFLLGKQLLESGHAWEEVRKHWKRSMTYDSRHTSEILSISKDLLTENEVASQLLPEDPRGMFEFGQVALSVWAPEIPDRLLRAVANTLETQDEERFASPGEKAQLIAATYSSYGEHELACKFYESAIRDDIQNVGWRLQYAQSLVEMKDFPGALRQTSIVRTLRPGNREAESLVGKISKLQANPMQAVD